MSFLWCIAKRFTNITFYLSSYYYSYNSLLFLFACQTSQPLSLVILIFLPFFNRCIQIRNVSSSRSTGKCFLVSLPWQQRSHTAEQVTAGMLQASSRPLPCDFSQHLAQLCAPPLNIKGKPGLLPLCLCVRQSQLYL